MPGIPLPPGIESDPDIYAAVKQLALDSINEAASLLSRGSVPTKIQVIRMMMPSVTRSLNQPDEDADDELRETVAQMYENIRTQLQS